MSFVLLLLTCLACITVTSADFFRDLEKLDIDSQLNEIDKMLNNIEVDEKGAMDTLMGNKGTDKPADEPADIFSNLFDRECQFKCEDGSKPKVRRGHKPSSNGCGSFGLSFELEDLPEMTSCCDKHDMCYDTCGTNRDECDDEFKECLDKMCKKLKKTLSKKEHQGCKDMTRLMYTGTIALGCKPYLQGQESACICDSEAKMADKTSTGKPNTKSETRDKRKGNPNEGKNGRKSSENKKSDTKENKSKKPRTKTKDEL